MSFQLLHIFIAKSKAHFNLIVVYLYCDNGREYLSNGVTALEPTTLLAERVQNISI